MNTKHTPGPWTIRPSQHDERHYAIHAASAMRWVAHVAVENNEANARLIAAAPELLEALQMFTTSVHTCNYCDGSGTDESGNDTCHACHGFGLETSGDTLEAYHEARAAIAKATNA